MIYDISDSASVELLELASSKIDELTFNRINQIGFDNLTEFQKNKISRATQLQAEYYEEYGTEESFINSFGISGMNISLDTKNSQAPNGVSAAAYSLLKQTGLMNRMV